MAFCTNCGETVAEGVKFCPSCGQRVDGEDSAPVEVEGGEDTKQKNRRNTTIGCLVVAVIVIGVLIGVFVAVSDDEPNTADTSQLACDHFRNVADDVRRGVLTDAELREKLTEIDDNASIATPPVQGAAERMLRAATQGDSAGLTRAVGEMDQACTDAGH